MSWLCHLLTWAGSRPQVSIIKVSAIVSIACVHSATLADPGDERCFPLYREANAIPRTPQCMIRVQAAPTGLGSFTCQLPEPQRRYCEGDEKSFDICPRTPYPIIIATGTKTLKESDYAGCQRPSPLALDG